MIEAPFFNDVASRPSAPVEALWSPANPALQAASALDRVRRAPTILKAMRTLALVTTVVDAAVEDGVDSHALLEPVLEAQLDRSDTVTAIAAVHALARIPGPRAALALADVVTDGRPGFEEHALWALSARPTTHMLAWPVARAVAHGGLAGMHAQQVLSTWAATDPHLVLAALTAVLGEVEAASARRYLTETLGLVPGKLATGALEQLYLDPDEDRGVRGTAISAFNERVGDAVPATIHTLDGELGDAARFVRAHRQLLRRGPRRFHRDGLRVAQVHLGETGGLATLLPQLGDALAGQQRFAEPLTIVRAGMPTRDTATGHRIDEIALEPGEGSTFDGRWPSTVKAARGIRAAFLAGSLPDLVHLRMADPGTYAATEVALSLNIPLVYTLAPDPQGPLAAAEAAGTVDRETFADEDARSALWFRTSLVERLAAEARELVLFPREDLRKRIGRLTDVDLAAGPPRHTVVAEGVDIGRSDAAARKVATSDDMPLVLADLQTAISRLPKDRHGLPLVVSAGRLVELKGMARLVEAFAHDEALAARANLVIIGGNLSDPSAAEAAELARIRSHFGDHPKLQDRVVLLGQQAHPDVALVLAAARAGWRSLIGPGGSYACASDKEEFGLAIVEALAAGLPVTAPSAGGPATYVEPGRSGTLVETTDIGALAHAVGSTLDLAFDPVTASRARAVVEERYTLERMARSLTAVYRVTTGASTLGAAVTTATEGAA